MSARANYLAVLFAVAITLFGTCASYSLERRIRDGLILRETQLAGGVRMTSLEVSLDRHDVRVLSATVPRLDGSPPIGGAGSAPEREAKGFFLRDYQRRYRTVATMAAGFIYSFSPPKSFGLVKSSGEIVSLLAYPTLLEGMFCTAAGRAAITMVPFIGTHSEIDNFRDCIQAGPILLRNGAKPSGTLTGPSSPSSPLVNWGREEQHAFVCISRGDRLILGITGAIELIRLVDFLLSPDFGCIDAIRLSSRETAVLLVDDVMIGTDKYLFPSALGVISRDRQ